MRVRWWSGWTLMLWAVTALAGARTPADSTSVYPARVPHRSALEEAAAVPGRILYLVPATMSYTMGRAATLFWEYRVLDRMRRALTFYDGRVGLRPLSNSLRGSGLRFFVNDLVETADAEATTTVGSSSSTRQHVLLSLMWQGGRRLSAHYSSEPSEGFYGIGAGSLAADKSSFRQRDAYVGLNCRPRKRGPLRYDWDLNYHVTDIGPGSSLPSITSLHEDGALAGLEDRLHFFEAGMNVKALFVDVPGSPSRGHRSRLRVAYRQSIDDDEYSMVTVAFLTEQFLELFYRRTVSLQIGGQWRQAPFGDRLPFYDLSALGGTEILRGYTRGRFRDRGVAYAVGTYKFPVWDLLEGNLFWEHGRTFHRPADLDLDDWQYSAGGGLRAWIPKGVLFELTLARSRELTRLHFSFSSEF